jgi:hypothetical protein
MNSIILNNSNVQPNGFNNVLVYDFPAGAVTFQDAKIAVASISMYYSWFNITSATSESQYNNNLFTYTWYSSSSSTTHNVLIPDGYYSATTLNAYLQSVMLANGHYLEDEDGNNVFYLEILENPTKYAIELRSYAVPSSLPSGYINPASLTLPNSSKTPQFTILSNNNFRDIIGFTPGSYPSVVQSSNYSITSNYTPQFSPVSSLVLLLDFLDNKLANPSSVFYTFSAVGTSFGGLIQITPSTLLFNKIRDGQYNNIKVSILDQSFRPVFIKDTNLTILLSVAQQD